MAKTPNYNLEKGKRGHQVRDDDIERADSNLDIIDNAIPSSTLLLDEEED